MGGVIGALAGGIPAWLIARRQSNETLRRDNEERRRQELALSFSVHVKLFTIINSTIHDWKHVHAALAERMLPAKAHMEPWQIVRPLAGHPAEEQITFSSQELALFLAMGENEFMHEILLLAQRHAATVQAMQEYMRRRDQMMQQRAPIPDEFVGDLGLATITEEEWRKLRPYSVMLNSLVDQLSEQLTENLELCRKVANSIGPLVQAYFKDPKRGGLSFPTEEELGEMIALSIPPSDQG